MLNQFDDEETAAYFERLNAPLRKMPQADRAELHAELRQHLDALAAAHEELGASPVEAAHAALKQFGDPKRIGRRLFGEWRRSRPPSLWSAIGHMTFWKLVMLALSLTTGFSLGSISVAKFNGVVGLPTACLLFIISPLFAGIITGLKMPKKAAPGALYSGLPFVLPFLIMVLSGNGDGLSSLILAFNWLVVSFIGAHAASAYRRGGFYRLSLSDFKFNADPKEERHAHSI